MSEGTLPEPARTVVRLSAAMADRETALEAELGEARARVEGGSVPARAVEEALLQAYLFLGFPAVLEAFSAWRSTGVEARPGDGRESAPAAWGERGRRLCRRVYAGAYERLRENVCALHPELDRWMVEEGYGKVLSRPGLTPVERELAIVSQLAAAGWPRQLRSHLHGALNVGAEAAEVEAALTAAERVCGRGLDAARTIWLKVREADGCS